MAIQTANHADIFAALDQVYGLIDGSASWQDCLEALTSLSGVQVAKLMLYDCGDGQSRIVEASGIADDKGRLVQDQDIDEALWQSKPGVIWLPPGGNGKRSSGVGLFGYAVLDRDPTHILYLEFSTASIETRTAAGRHLLQSVLPHLHRVCRLRRSITGDDLLRFAAPDITLSSTAAGLPIELRLRRRFKLSKAEARVATLLSDGLAPRMIAARLNVSIHTVRSQLQAIFSKTATSRQAELTSLILRETEVPPSLYPSNAISMPEGERPPCP